jgi:FAD/FMN-containing dehydrogenase
VSRRLVRATQRGDAAYEDVRRGVLWNERVPRRYPDAIVVPADEDEVVATVRAARRDGLTIAVRSGGHSWTAAPLRDGGVLLDLRRLNAFSIEREREAISTQPAVAVRDLAAALTQAELGFPTGHCPTVCLGGFLLAGGWGWNSQRWGPACHRVEAIDVVRADGELVHADAQRHPDLLWAARGAGPGFPGVVTRFELRAAPLPRAIATCEFVYDLQHLPAVVGWLVEVAADVPPTVKHGMKLARPEGGDGAPVLSVGATTFAASREEAAAALDFFSGCPVAGEAISAARNPDSSYADLYRGMAMAYPERHRYAADTLWSDSDPVDLISRIAERLTTAPSSQSFVTLALSSASLPPAPDPGAALSMKGRLFVGCYARWQTNAEDAANITWVDDLMRSLEPDAVGHYLGEMDLERWHPSRAYAPEQWSRLEALRARLDPDGLFHGFPHRIPRSIL